MDKTPLIHSVIAVVTQVAAGMLLDNWWIGGLAACAWWASREHAQSEYRWIQRFGHGQRDNMPWWGGFDLRVWDWSSILDAAVPAALCTFVYLWVASAI